MLGLPSDGPYPTFVTSVSVTNSAGVKVCVVQDWRWSIAIGELHVDFNENGEVTSCEGCPVLMVDDTFLDGSKNEVDAATRNGILQLIESNPGIEYVRKDPVAEKKLEPYKQGIEEFGREVVAQVKENLWHVWYPGQTHPEGGVITDGSYAAPHVSQSMLRKANQVGLNAHMAVINAGGIRRDILSGDLTVGDIYELLPFENTLVIAELTGEVIRDILDQWASHAGGGQFPYLAGARYSVDMNLPEGQRITGFEIENEDGHWEPVDSNTRYRVVSISFLNLDQYNPSYFYDTGFIDAEVFQEYAHAVSPLVRIPTNVTYIPENQ